MAVMALVCIAATMRKSIFKTISSGCASFPFDASKSHWRRSCGVFCSFSRLRSVARRWRASITGTTYFFTLTISARSFCPHCKVQDATGRRAGWMVRIFIEKTATDAVYPMMISSHVVSRDIVSLTMIREVIWPIALNMSENAWTDVYSGLCVISARTYRARRYDVMWRHTL